jgi:protein-S-isoprenylcysteine O-methyltransferase Ste14
MALQDQLVKQGNFLFRHRGTLPILIAVPALAIKYWGAPMECLCITSFNTIAYGLSILGLVIRFIAVGYSPKNTSGRNTQGQLADSLSSTGIYSICRHPLYIGNFFMWFGVAMLTANSWFLLSFFLAYWIYYERIMIAEETFLAGKFGEAYTNWANSTPAVIPSFKLWKPYSTTFNLRKSIKQEKTGFLLLNGCFLLFNAIHSTSLCQVWDEQKDWSILAIASVLLYAIIKIWEKSRKESN